jgi:RHH-type proline utilization regulon transcriptional repressor/proline dehydrogenase/delta 1-pyrroline-5-carboxylate dehydrogenase
MIFAEPLAAPDPLRLRLRAVARADETSVVEALLAEVEQPPAAQAPVAARAAALVRKVRERRVGQGGLDAFLQQYQLASREGVVLMCLAEALLRIPDAETADRLIRDKLAGAEWEKHLGTSDSLFVNASTWALMLTGRLVGPEPEKEDWARVMKRLLPVARLPMYP